MVILIATPQVIFSTMLETLALNRSLESLQPEPCTTKREHCATRPEPELNPNPQGTCFFCGCWRAYRGRPRESSTLLALGCRIGHRGATTPAACHLLIDSERQKERERERERERGGDRQTDAFRVCMHVRI